MCLELKLLQQLSAKAAQNQFKLKIFQAGDRIRTGDVQLGKLTFYH